MVFVVFSINEKVFKMMLTGWHYLDDDLELMIVCPISGRFRVDCGSVWISYYESSNSLGLIKNIFPDIMSWSMTVTFQLRNNRGN